MECSNKQSNLSFCINDKTTNTSKIIYIKVFSRHSGSKSYRVYIEYLPQPLHVEYNLPYNPNAIKGWYCECKNGARTLGCCCHAASIIFYCAYKRFCETIEKPGQHLIEIFPSSIRDLGDDENQTQTQTQTETQTLTQTQALTQTQTQPLSFNRSQRHSNQVKRKSN